MDSLGKPPNDAENRQDTKSSGTQDQSGQKDPPVTIITEPKKGH